MAHVDFQPSRSRGLAESRLRSGNPSHKAIAGVAADQRKTGLLRHGESVLQTLMVIRLRRRDQQSSTHIASGHSASSADAFPREVDGFLTRFAILCARKSSAESLDGYTSGQDS